MILAAGLGERMRPLTEDIPKPLLKVAGRTLVDWTIKRLSDAGIDNIVVAVGWKGSQVENHLSSEKNVQVVQVVNYEIGPLQTLATAIETFDDDFLLTPVDIMTDSFVLPEMISHFRERPTSEIMTLAIYDASSKGTLVSTRNGMITGLGNEVNDSDTMSRSAMLFMGNSSIAKECKMALEAGETKFVSVLNKWVHEGRSLKSYRIAESSFDIDSLSDLLEADKLTLSREKFTEADHIYVPQGDIFEVGDVLPLSSNITLHKGIEIIGPVLVSSGCEIGERCRIGPNVSLDSNSKILAGCVISDSIVLGESTILSQSRIRRTIVYNSKQYYVD